MDQRNEPTQSYIVDHIAQVEEYKNMQKNKNQPQIQNNFNNLILQEPNPFQEPQHDQQNSQVINQENLIRSQQNQQQRQQSNNRIFEVNQQSPNLVQLRQENINQLRCTYCNSSFTEQRLQQHQIDCEQRPIRCLYCDQEYPKFLMEDHEEQCHCKKQMQELINNIQNQRSVIIQNPVIVPQYVLQEPQEVEEEKIQEIQFQQMRNQNEINFQEIQHQPEQILSSQRQQILNAQRLFESQPQNMLFQISEQQSQVSDEQQQQFLERQFEYPSRQQSFQDRIPPINPQQQDQMQPSTLLDRLFQESINPEVYEFDHLQRQPQNNGRIQQNNIRPQFQELAQEIQGSIGLLRTNFQTRNQNSNRVRQTQSVQRGLNFPIFPQMRFGHRQCRAHHQIQKDTSTIPEYTFSNNRNLSPSAKYCSICQSEFEQGEQVKILGCTHRFHTGCIISWLKEKQICPICKRNAFEGLTD